LGSRLANMAAAVTTGCPRPPAVRELGGAEPRGRWVHARALRMGLDCSLLGLADSSSRGLRCGRSLRRGSTPWWQCGCSRIMTRMTTGAVQACKRVSGHDRSASRKIPSAQQSVACEATVDRPRLSHVGVSSSQQSPRVQQPGRSEQVVPSSTNASAYSGAALGRSDFSVQHIAVFPDLADVVDVKTGSRPTAHWRIHFIRLNRWLRHSFAQLITLLDIDGIGQNWVDSNKGVSSNGDNRATQPPRVRIVWPCYWLCNRQAKTKL